VIDLWNSLFGVFCGHLSSCSVARVDRGFANGLT
jgi:hypothetical protein